MKRAALVTLAVVVALTAIAVAREMAIGRAEMEAADRAAARAEAEAAHAETEAKRAAAAAHWAEAILHARAAAEAVAPGSPWPERARLRLAALGHDAEARGEGPTALLAYGALRAASIATRGPGSASALWQARAEEGLARVAASPRDPSAPHTTPQAMRDALRADDPPSSAALALLGAGFLCALIGLASVLLPR
jgi:hypothetical protein